MPAGRSLEKVETWITATHRWQHGSKGEMVARRSSVTENSQSVCSLTFEGGSVEKA